MPSRNQLTIALRQLTRDVAIFWDLEKCRIPVGADPEDIVQRVHDAAMRYGTVKVFKAYASPENVDITKPSEALKKRGGVFVRCHRQYKRQMEIAAMRIIADMFTHGLDTQHKAHFTTMVLISGEGDFIDTITKLRDRHFEVVVIAPSIRKPKLCPLASDFVEWQVVTGQPVSSPSSVERNSIDRKLKEPNADQTSVVRKEEKPHQRVVTISIDDLKSFAPLVAFLYKKGSPDARRVTRNAVAFAFGSLLVSDSSLYERAGCKDLRGYLMRAASLYIVMTSATGKGTNDQHWVALHPAIHGHFATQQPAWFKTWLDQFS